MKNKKQLDREELDKIKSDIEEIKDLLKKLVNPSKFAPVFLNNIHIFLYSFIACCGLCGSEKLSAITKDSCISVKISFIFYPFKLSTF